MQRLTKCDWIGIIVSPLMALTAGVICLHISKPDHPVLLSRWKEAFAFDEVFFKLLPTLIAISFVYWLGILPYIRSRVGRAPILLTIFVVPALACGVSIMAVVLFVVIEPEYIKGVCSNWQYVIQRPDFDNPYFRWFLVFSSIWVIFTVLVTVSGTVAYLADRSAKYLPDPPRIGNALSGGLLIMVISLPMWYSIVTQHKRDSERVACISNIQRVQQAMRAHQGLNSLYCGQELSKKDIVGVGLYLESEPRCPAGGTYSWSGKCPDIGQLMIRCSCPSHVPVSYEGW